MDSISIDLKGSEISSIDVGTDAVAVHFARAYLLKTMTGADERTRWWQAGDLIIEGGSTESRIPQAPLVCEGGDIDENIYTYRDMIPVPLASRGHARCWLRFAGHADPLIVTGTGIHLVMQGTPKYIEHLRPA